MEINYSAQQVGVSKRGAVLHRQNFDSFESCCLQPVPQQSYGSLRVAHRLFLVMFNRQTETLILPVSSRPILLSRGACCRQVDSPRAGGNLSDQLL
jgi:hypothetical protein